MTCDPDKHEMVKTLCHLQYGTSARYESIYFCSICGVTKEALLEAHVKELKEALKEIAKSVLLRKGDVINIVSKAIGRTE